MIKVFTKNYEKDCYIIHICHFTQTRISLWLWNYFYCINNLITKSWALVSYFVIRFHQRPSGLFICELSYVILFEIVSKNQAKNSTSTLHYLKIVELTMTNCNNFFIHLIKELIIYHLGRFTFSKYYFSLHYVSSHKSE